MVMIPQENPACESHSRRRKKHDLTPDQTMALAVKYIIDCGKKEIRVRNLSKESRISGHVFRQPMGELVKDGYLKIERTANIPVYSVNDMDRLKNYYNSIKSNLPKDSDLAEILVSKRC